MLNQPSYSSRDSESDKKRNISSDKLLWNSVKEGSRKSFRYIYDQNYERLINYGSKFTADQSMVEDQIQELFIYLWQKKELLNIHSSITVYLLWSLRNRIFKCLKEIKTYSIASEYDLIENSEEPTDELKYDSLSIAIKQLPPKQREVISLKYFQNLDGDEIAKIMGISIGTTYNLLSRAISNLRKKIVISIVLSTILFVF